MRFRCCQILRKQFQELKKVENLSLRNWSASVGLSPAYVSLVLNSKRLPSLKTLKKFGEYLEMDKLGLANLVDAYQLDWLRKHKIRATPFASPRRTTLPDEVEVTMMPDSDIFRYWLNLALSEFTLCEGFTEDPQRLAQIFQVTPQEIKTAFHWLTVSGFLERNDNGVLQKKYKKIRFPISHRSRQHVRDFHKQMMRRAVKHMDSNTDQEAYARRLINGYTIAVNPDKIDEAKLMLQKSLAEIAELLSVGASKDVYQLQVQFFPLTKI